MSEMKPPRSRSGAKIMPEVLDGERVSKHDSAQPPMTIAEAAALRRALSDFVACLNDTLPANADEYPDTDLTEDRLRSSRLGSRELDILRYHYEDGKRLLDYLIEVTPDDVEGASSDGLQ
jgi:hypothetical protein